MRNTKESATEICDIYLQSIFSGSRGNDIYSHTKS